MVEALNIKELTGKDTGIKFVDLKKYRCATKAQTANG
jgi:hypothetical protein